MRQRFVYRPDHPQASTHGFVPIEVAGADPEPSKLPVVTDLWMDGVKAIDAEGTDIGSHKKRREYMQRNDLVDADDFKGEWAKAEKIRREGDPKDRASRRALIGRLDYEMEKKHGRRG